MGGCILEFNCERTTRVISSVFVYHLDDPDLRVEIIFTKQGTTENKRYRHLCTLVLAVEENSRQSLSALLLLFWWFFVEFFWFAYLEFKIEEKMHIKAVMLLICLEVLGEQFFCFPGGDWEGVCRKLLSKTEPEVLNITYIPEFKHGVTNHCCLHCAILKDLHGFHWKKAHKSRDMQCFLENVQNEILKIFKMFKY